jgi:hypothetical protein
VSDWNISFDDELERVGYRMKYTYTCMYNVYAPNGAWISCSRNKADARTAAYNHWQNSKQPTIVCLCGSTRFSEAFHDANLRETLDGKIVLTIGCDMRSDAELFADKNEIELKLIKARLDVLHLRKIDLADEVLILNVDGYVGESTRRELEYARAEGKRVRWLEPERVNL